MITITIISFLTFILSLILLKNYNYSETHERFYLFLAGCSIMSFLIILISQL